MGAGLGGTKTLDLWFMYMPAIKNTAILSMALPPEFPASQPKMKVFKIVSKEL